MSAPRILTLRQPWAEAMRLGMKTIETRGWQTKFRGLVYIHSGKADMNPDEKNLFRGRYFAGLRADELARGKIVAAGVLVECVRTEYVGSISDRERALGNYGPGRWAWLFRDVRPIDGPSCGGQLGLWRPKMELQFQLQNLPRS